MDRAKESEGRSKPDYDNITNQEIQTAIDTWIHSKRDRLILKLRLIDGLTYSQIEDYLYNEEHISLSERRIKTIVSNAEGKLFKHI